ncbi:lamin tail domain-containing protein [Candidatus Parcubacteria bacterium]|nr:lamin tail domain-containing protein [Candidatus Parcubacteria bacterium]
MEKFLRIFLLILFALLSADFVFAANSPDIVINEIAWMGTNISHNDEWIELYNNSNSSIKLDGWLLKTVDGSPKIELEGIIPAKSFYLLERTNDESVPEIPANQIYTGALSNKGEKLELYDNLGNLIDSVDCSSGWIAGDNKTKRTMERKSPKQQGSHPGSWQTSQNPNGTPKAKNSIIKAKAEETRLPPKLAKVGSLETEKVSDVGSLENVENLAAIGEQVPMSKSPTPFFILFVSSIIAIFSGTIILTLKKKIETKKLI